MEGDGGGSTLNATVNNIAPASTTKVDNEVENGTTTNWPMMTTTVVITKMIIYDRGYDDNTMTFI